MRAHVIARSVLSIAVATSAVRSQDPVRKLRSVRIEASPIDSRGFSRCAFSSTGRFACFVPSAGLIMVLNEHATEPRMITLSHGALIETLGWLGDSVWTFDRMARRVDVFSPAGRVARGIDLSHVTLGDDTLSLDYPFALRGDGSILSATRLPSLERDAYLIPTGTVRVVVDRRDRYGYPISSGVVRIGPDAKANMVLSTEPEGYVVNFRVGDKYQGAQVPFGSRPALHVSPDGERAAWAVPGIVNGRPVVSLTVIRASGDTIFRAQPSRDARRVTTRQADSAVEALSRNLDGEFKVAIRERMRQFVPEFFGANASTHVTRDGHVWLTWSTPKPGATYLVYDPMGNLMGEVAPRAALVAVNGMEYWTLEKQKTGVWLFEHFRIGQ